MLCSAACRRNDMGHCVAVVRAPLPDTSVRHCPPASARTAWVDVSTERPAHNGGAVNVVTVDDQPYFRGAARDVIGATPGFQSVGEAGSGAEALEVVNELDPQLVLVDVRMPDMDGIDTLRAMHAESSVVPPVVFMTASGLDSESSVLGEFPVAGVVAKPFNPMTLPAELEAMLGWAS
jgi:CheY-like chemotaxis protein